MKEFADDNSNKQKMADSTPNRRTALWEKEKSLAFPSVVRPLVL